MATYVKPVVFRVGKEVFGVDINLVQSIEKQVSVVPVPNSMEFIHGLINLRGEVVPVYNLKKKFQIAETDQAENMIIISAGAVKIALEVDEVLEINDINPEKIVAMPVLARTGESRYLDRVAQVDGQLIILLDVEQLLTADEAEDMKKITEQMQNA